jgi:hypothetical protein
MKCRLFVSAFVLLLPVLARADGVADYARAQLMFAKVMNAIQQSKQVAATAADAGAATGAAAAVAPAVPTPLTDKSGKFFLPYDEKGQLVGWANKAIGAQVGAAVGAKAGEKAGSAMLAKVPFGGLLAGAAKKKGKELGALAAVGGADFVKQSSSFSFARLDDMALYLHVNYSSNPDYIKALAAALAIYPDLEQTYDTAVKKAYGTF